MHEITLSLLFIYSFFLFHSPSSERLKQEENYIPETNLPSICFFQITGIEATLEVLTKCGP